MRYFTGADDPGDMVFRLGQDPLVTEAWDRVHKKWIDWPELVRPDPDMEYREISESDAQNMIADSTSGRA